MPHGPGSELCPLSRTPQLKGPIGDPSGHPLTPAHAQPQWSPGAACSHLLRIYCPLYSWARPFPCNQTWASALVQQSDVIGRCLGSCTALTAVPLSQTHHELVLNNPVPSNTQTNPLPPPHCHSCVWGLMPGLQLPLARLALTSAATNTIY